MNNNTIVEMKHTDIRTVDKSKLVDISTIKINPSDSRRRK